jgi:hypothetical protein
MLLNNGIKKNKIQMVLKFQKEIYVILYIIEFFLQSKLESFYLNKISIRYEFSKFTFL